MEMNLKLSVADGADAITQFIILYLFFRGWKYVIRTYFTEINVNPLMEWFQFG